MMRTIGLVFALIVLAASPATAETPRTLTWDDLVPKDVAYPDDPLLRLNAAQQEDLGFILRVRDVQSRASLAKNSGLALALAERTEKLRSAGIDVDDLIARMRTAYAASRAAGEKVETALDGQLIRMPGYVLPVEFSGSTITEFLLVPFVGACIHVPPPPPNQIVYVTVPDGFEDEGIFTPVYITGRMSVAGGGSKSVFITDGDLDVSFGYGLDATKVEKYVE